MGAIFENICNHSEKYATQSYETWTWISSLELFRKAEKYEYQESWSRHDTKKFETSEPCCRTTSEGSRLGMSSQNKLCTLRLSTRLRTN